MILENQDEKIDLSEVFYDLDHPAILRTKKVNSLFHKFAQLMGKKPSFASHVHSVWKKLVK